jgi:transposase
MSISEHKHMPEPARRIEVFTGAGRRRSWSGEEKASIIAESYGAGETVCAVARRHGLTPQQLFAWRRLARRSGSVLPAMFVPAVVEPAVVERVQREPQGPRPPRRARRRSKAEGIELEIAGVEVRVGADAKPRAIEAMIRALKAHS